MGDLGGLSEKIFEKFSKKAPCAQTTCGSNSNFTHYIRDNEETRLTHFEIFQRQEEHATQKIDNCVW